MQTVTVTRFIRSLCFSMLVGHLDQIRSHIIRIIDKIKYIETQSAHLTARGWFEREQGGGTPGVTKDNVEIGQNQMKTRSNHLDWRI